MNCEPGDLAIVVRSESGNEGKIVRCLSLTTHLWFTGDELRPEPTWVIDQRLPGARGGLLNKIADDQLRPIRDPGDDAVDESKAWLPPLPQTTKEAA